MRNVLLVLKNNLQQLRREKIILVMMITVLPLVIYFGIYFGQMDNIKGKIAIVGATNQQKESIRKSILVSEKVNLEFLDKKPTNTELIKGIYLAEINFTKDETEVISYRNEDVKKAIEANIRGEIYEGNKEHITVQGKIIGFLTMYLLMGSLMIMEFFLTDRENGVYVRVLFGKLSYYEYAGGQILYAICALTFPTIIMSLALLKILSVDLGISIGLFSLLVFLLGLLSSSFSMLLCTLCKTKVSAEMGGSIIILVTSLLGGCLINIVDSNKIIGFVRDCLPQKRIIDLANKFNNEDLMFLIITIVLFLLISVVVGKRQYENGDFL